MRRNRAIDFLESKGFRYPVKAPPSAISLAVLGMVLFVCPAYGQQLEPLLWSKLPAGANFLGAAYAYSDGNVSFDPGLPIKDVKAQIHDLALRYVRGLRLFGRSGRFEAGGAYRAGDWSGVVEGEFRTAQRDGFGDPNLRLAVNLLESDHGSPWVPTVLGLSLSMAPPLGDYERDRLINTGSNRWTFRPQLGLQERRGKWVFELTGSAWFFTDNDRFAGDNLLEQAPLAEIQGHVLYFARPGLWVGLNLGYANGGRTTVNGRAQNTLQQNLRVGLTVSVPIGHRHGVKVFWNSGLATTIGGDFDRFGVAYQYGWGGGL